MRVGLFVRPEEIDDPESCGDPWPEAIWQDTAWNDLELARETYPKVVYRAVLVEEEER